MNLEVIDEQDIPLFTEVDVTSEIFHVVPFCDYLLNF